MMTGIDFFTASVALGYVIAPLPGLLNSSTQTVLSFASQIDSIGHSAQSGLRAWQIFLPNQIT
ncbi:exported hypothetical protein [Acidobacteriia bacterium SbA2]|nr:exported hypothetical protein [Acidobacteriia bacterium SbA2]